jgi:hypothetical protein
MITMTPPEHRVGLIQTTSLVLSCFAWTSTLLFGVGSVVAIFQNWPSRMPPGASPEPMIPILVLLALASAALALLTPWRVVVTVQDAPSSDNGAGAAASGKTVHLSYGFGLFALDQQFAADEVAGACVITPDPEGEAESHRLQLELRDGRQFPLGTVSSPETGLRVGAGLLQAMGCRAGPWLNAGGTPQGLGLLALRRITTAGAPRRA